MKPWLSTFFGKGEKRILSLTDAQQQALAAWRELPVPDTNASHQATRYVVADVETSGLNMEKDHLISIGAVAVVNGMIDSRDAFEVVLRQDEVSSHANILIHGIGGAAQREGLDPADALLEFLAYAGKSPLVAYHALFDQTVIARAMFEHLDLRFKPTWVDLALVAPDLFREVTTECGNLDDWLQQFGIENIQRHNALSDAYATAQLLQVVIARAAHRDAGSPASFLRLQKSRHWMHGAH